MSVVRAVSALFLAAGVSLSCAGLVPSRNRENVLVVVFDDLGIDKVPAYGVHPAAPPMPALDALAREGVRFSVAYGAPSCSPTRAALMTGRYGRHTGVNVPVIRTDPFELGLAETTLPEVLAERGVRTGAVGKWHLSSEISPTGRSHPRRSGFDFFVGELGNLGGPSGDYRAWREVGADGREQLVRGDNTAHLADVAIDSLRNTPEPWLLYLAFHAPHEPFQPVPGSALPPDAPIADLYDAMATHADLQFARVLAAIPPAVRARTWIIALGDNGTPGEVMRPPLDPERGKLTVWEGGVRIPLLVAGPGVVGPGRASPALVHVVDVMPTMAERFGAPLPPSLDGKSFLGALTDPEDRGPRRSLFTQRLNPNGFGPWEFEVSTVRDETTKLVRWRNGSEGVYRVGTGLDEGAEVPEPLDPATRAAAARLRTALEAELRGD